MFAWIASSTSIRRVAFCCYFVLSLILCLVLIDYGYGIYLNYKDRKYAHTIERSELEWQSRDPWKDLPFPIFIRNANAWEKVDGSFVYNVEYTIDRFARRYSVRNSSASAKKSLLLLGCSYAFGEALSDGDTLASMLNQAEPRIQSYNYGMPGASPGEILLRLRSIDVHQELPEPIETVVYLFMDGHISRLVGSMSVTGSWGPRKLHFYLDKQGKLQEDGGFSKVFYWRTKFFKLLKRSNIINYNSIDYPFSIDDSTFSLFATIVKEMQLESRKMGAKKFLLVFHPESTIYAKRIIPYLKKEGIDYLDLSSLDMEKLTDHHAGIPFNGHPTGDSNRVLASWIKKAIF